MSATKEESQASGDLIPKVGDQCELTIESLAFGGKGIARAGGFVLFVKNGLPRQTVLARITRKRKNFGEAMVVEVLSESPLATPPRCSHFPTCGGCTFQNLDYEFQLQQKKQQVLDLYSHLGGTGSTTLNTVAPAESVFHYRNKMEFSFSNRRWVLPEEENGAKKEFALGLHVPGRYDKILDIDTCWIQKPVGNEILQTVRRVSSEEGLQPYNILNHTGFLRNLVIRVGERTGEVMVNLVTAREEPNLLHPIVERMVNNFPQISSIVNNITRRKAGVSYGEWEVVLHGLPYIHELLDGYRFEISANSFFQTNTVQAEKLLHLAVEFARLSQEDVVYDLYCGTGSTSILVAPHVKQVYGFELISAAVEDAMRNALSNELHNCRFFQGNLDNYFRVTPVLTEIEKPDVILVDPPRSGMHPKLVKDVLTMRAQKLVYISCNPATQARDVSLLIQGGYELKRLAMVDMFPHTPHIETVALLSLPGAE